MNYQDYYFEDYDLTLEIGNLSEDEVNSLLARFKADGAPKREEYEDFLLKYLIKKQKHLTKFFVDLAESDFNGYQKLRFRILDIILELNPRLQPTELVYVDNRIMYVADAIRLGKPTRDRLPLIPGWTASSVISAANKNIDQQLLVDTVNNIWDDLKKYDPTHDYRKEKVDILNVDIPILHIDGTFKVETVLQDFITSLCNGDVTKAVKNQALWIAHVLAYTVPRIDDIKGALVDAGYLEVYGQSVVLLQLYIAVLQINPELNWEILDWSPFLNKSDAPAAKGKPHLKSRYGKIIDKKPIRSKEMHQPSSKEEIEAEQLHFNTVSFEDILSLKDRLKKHIIGQEDAIDSLADAIAIARVGLRGENKPIGSFLLAGTTGVGKTELAKVIAEELTQRPLIRIDCSEYQQSHEIAKLFGSPPGYVGFEDNDPRLGAHTPPSTLATKIKANPFSVVLFDEIEKAHEAIYNVLLHVMDEGHITSGRGETCRFSEALILLTSNIGAKEADKATKSNKLGFGQDDRVFSKVKHEIIDKSIKDTFKPEFLNRLTEIIHFNQLTEEVCETIVDVLLGKTAANLLRAQNMVLSWDTDVKKFLVEKGFSQDYGARNLERTIHKEVELPLAKSILKNRFKSSVGSTSDDSAKKVGFDPQLAKQETIKVKRGKKALEFELEKPDAKKIDT